MTPCIQPNIPRRTLLTLTAALLTPPARAAAPEPSPPAPRALYQATAIVTGTDTRQRPAGIADCLRQVLLKLTAAPSLRTDPAVSALAANPDPLIDHFTYVDARAALLHHDDQGTYDRPHELTVWFKPDAIDAAIVQLGRHIWPEPRPVLVPVILVRTREPDPFLLSADAPPSAASAPLATAMRAALVRVAATYGVGIHFPTANELAEWSVDTIGPPAPLEPAPNANLPNANLPHANLIVAGTLSFNIKETGWTGIWTATIDGTEHQWEIHGVGFDTAFQNLADGAIQRAAGTDTP